MSAMGRLGLGFQPRAKCWPLSPRREPRVPPMAFKAHSLAGFPPWNTDSLCPLRARSGHTSRIACREATGWPLKLRNLTKKRLQTIHLYTAGAPYPEVNTTS